MFRHLLLSLLLASVLATDLYITRLNSPKGPDPCARVCAGTTGKGSTIWNQSGAPYYFVNTYVDISECDFVGTPVITALVDGNGDNWQTTLSGTSTSGATKDGFNVYLFGFVGIHSNPGHSGPTAAIASAGQWNVNWQAVGYMC